MDFRGLIFIVFGAGQVVGIISSLFCKEPERNMEDDSFDYSSHLF